MAAAFIGVCGHASSEFFAVFSGVSGPEVSVWRYMIGAAGLLVWALATPASRDLLGPLRTAPMRFVLLSLAGVTGAYLAFHWALDFASVVQVATIVTTIPIFVGIANLAINGTAISTVKLITGAMATLGVVVLLTDGYLGDLTGETRTLFGIALALICAALAAVYSVLVKPFMAEHGALTVTTSSLLIGAIGLWVTVGIGWGLWVNPATLFEREPVAVTSLLILGLWNTTITQVLWLGGLAAAPDITRASYLFFLKPVIAAGLALIFLSQPITLLQGLAILLVTGSVAVEVLWPKVSRA
jgi:drug/metabolite transporter (DMT)-like permease